MEGSIEQARSEIVAVTRRGGKRTWASGFPRCPRVSRQATTT